MKKFGPYKFFKKRDLGNAQEMELPNGIHISPTFNIVELTKYNDDSTNEELMLEPSPIPTSKKEKIQ